jgi:D-alanine-D-alanine ligase
MPQDSGRRLRVGIVFGGQSVEHEISILSARNVLAALDTSRFEPVLIGIDKSGRWLTQDPQKLLASAQDPRLVSVAPGIPIQLAAPLTAHTISALTNTAPVDVLFPVLHGTFGEDGSIQGLFEVAGIPYVGAGVLGSAIGMDKDVMKRLLRDAQIPCARFLTVRRGQFDADPAKVCAQLTGLGFPQFIKPVSSGSSVGIRKVSDAAGLADAVSQAYQFDDKVIAEAAITGREIELAVLGGNPPTVSVAGEIIVHHRDGFYSYEAKYIDKQAAQIEVPARITPAEQTRAQRLALRAFEVLECDGMARVDLFLQDDGELLVNEINTIPGFTDISMYPKLWEASGLRATDLITRLIELALARGERRTQIRHSFASE